MCFDCLCKLQDLKCPFCRNPYEFKWLIKRVERYLTFTKPVRYKQLHWQTQLKYTHFNDFDYNHINQYKSMDEFYNAISQDY